MLLFILYITFKRFGLEGKLIYKFRRKDRRKETSLTIK
jgi:hypothetical protein